MAELVTNNSVEGNFIGTDKDGVTALPNSEGISIYSGASNNVVGGPSAASRNVISGNDVGVRVDGSNGTTITNNLVGLQQDGLASLANSDTGIYLSGDSNNTTIGGVSLTMNTAGIILVAEEVMASHCCRLQAQAATEW